MPHGTVSYGTLLFHGERLNKRVYVLYVRVWVLGSFFHFCFWMMHFFHSLSLADKKRENTVQGTMWAAAAHVCLWVSVSVCSCMFSFSSIRLSVPFARRHSRKTFFLNFICNSVCLNFFTCVWMSERTNRRATECVCVNNITLSRDRSRFWLWLWLGFISISFLNDGCGLWRIRLCCVHLPSFTT